MIIVSQDKRKIINFNNVIDIIINKYANTCSDITCCTLKDFEITLGEYDTEERAKEVLQEIIKAYIENKKTQETTSIFGFSIIPSNTYYEMPKE